MNRYYRSTLALITFGVLLSAVAMPPAAGAGTPQSTGTPKASAVNPLQGLGTEFGNGAGWGDTLRSAYSYFSGNNSLWKGAPGSLDTVDSTGDQFKIRFRTVKVEEDDFDSYRSRLLDTDKKWEEVNIERFPAMQREARGNGASGCRYDFRVLPKAKQVVQFHLEGPEDCSLDSAYQAMQDSLETFTR